MRLAFKRQVTSSISEKCRWQRGAEIRRQGLAWKESPERKQEELQSCWPAVDGLCYQMSQSACRGDRQPLAEEAGLSTRSISEPALEQREEKQK